MKKLLFLFVSLLSVGVFAQSKTIKGKIFENDVPLSGVKVSVGDLESLYKSSSEGTYEIKADIGDVISYSYPGKKTFEIIVEDVTSVLNVRMAPEVTELDEVVLRRERLKGRILTTREYDENKTYLNTSFGTVDLAGLPGPVRFLDGDKITPANRCILDVLRTYFPILRVTGSCSGATGTGGLTVRGPISRSDSQYAAYDIDGVLHKETPLWLIPSTIERIAILNGQAAVKYGRLGGAGVVVINTENGNYLKDDPLHPNYDRAKITNNIYRDEAKRFVSEADKSSIYLNQLKGAKNVAEAKSIYEANTSLVSGSYHFVLDAMQYFMDVHDDADYAQTILENHYSIFETNPVALKSVAYLYDTHDMPEAANEMYKEVFMLRPSYAQSYLDMADSYSDLGAYTKAASMFTRSNYLTEQLFLKTSETLTNLADREFNNLLQLKGNKLLSNNNPDAYLMEDDFKGTRLVFEWADSEAEFELQFVNPENRYEIWSHSLSENQDRITEEKTVGFNTQEYLIDDALKGAWQVNVKYLGNKTLTPSYLKATVYYNYGSPSQRKESTLFKLQERNLNLNLMRIENNSIVVTR